jgi:hypothetical protein
MVIAEATPAQQADSDLSPVTSVSSDVTDSAPLPAQLTEELAAQLQSLTLGLSSALDVAARLCGETDGVTAALSTVLAKLDELSATASMAAAATDKVADLEAIAAAIPTIHRAFATIDVLAAGLPSLKKSTTALGKLTAEAIAEASPKQGGLRMLMKKVRRVETSIPQRAATINEGIPAISEAIFAAIRGEPLHEAVAEPAEEDTAVPADADADAKLDVKETV